MTFISLQNALPPGIQLQTEPEKQRVAAMDIPVSHDVY